MRKHLVAAVVVLVVGVAGFVVAQGMMGPGFGGGMMGGAWDYIPPGDVKPITIDHAAETVKKYLAAWGDPDLKLAEVMEFTNHFYAEVEEESTGVHAFELLVNKYTGAIFPEPGPNMMWNTKYGHMGGGMMCPGMMGGGWRGWGRGMMGGPWGGWRGLGWQTPTAEMPVTPEQAKTYAQRFLDFQLPGTNADEEADAFYGYYTIHVLKDGKTYGMLSVNGYTGQVWYHNWHGQFVGMKEFEEHG
ncbi:MAG: PepSY domain-containing protein [bacterium]